MRYRSLLFVPGDSEKKFAKASGIGADVVILDLEDAVAPAQKSAARTLTARLIDGAAARTFGLYVRVNSLDTGLMEADLAAVVRPGLDGVLLPKAESAADAVTLGRQLDELEKRAGIAKGHVKIMVVATETARAMFNLGSYAPPPPRLVGLTWGAEDLAAALGASANKTADGDWTFPYQVARAQCLFAGAAADVAKIDTVYTDYRNLDGLAEDCRRAKRDGFTGRLAIHPDQVSVINACFSPEESDVAHAKRVVAAFAANPNAGTIGIDGKMYDVPHLKAARRILESAGIAV